VLTGSLAVWCETNDKHVAGLGPKIDLHFNLWLDLPGSVPGALDIGILLRESRQINALNIYIPADVSLDAIEDLSEVLRDETTLTAVFNSTLSIGDVSTHSFEVKNANDEIDFCIVRLNKEHDIAIQNLNQKDGTIIKFKPNIFSKINAIEGQHYIRFRLKLIGNLALLFQDSSNPSDSMFLSGFHSTDVIEFRVNERRNFPSSLRAIARKFPKIETIQYFLVRGIRTELTQAHENFRKIRRLEPGLWKGYLRELKISSPENWIIYQWKAGGTADANVEDFIALAFFERPRYHLESSLWL
jgi:hypothetical protein